MKNNKKAEKLFDAISDINESDIEDFAKYDDRLKESVPAKKERPVIKIIGAFAACLVLFGGISAGLKIAELRMNPNGPAATSTDTNDTAEETEEIQVKKHVYKNEAPYAELVKYEFTPEEQAYADRYYAEMVEKCPEFGKIPREKLWESIPLGGEGDFADFYFCIGSIGTDYGCSCNDHEYGYQEYNDALNGWRISGKEFEQFVDFQLSQTVNDAIIELLKKNVRAYAEENGLQLARFVDRDPDDILERCGFHYDDKNGLYVQSVTITDPTEPGAVSGHIYAAVGVEISGDMITLTEYPASSELIFVKEDDDYVYTFVPGGGAGDVTKPYLTPEKKAYTKKEQEKIDRCYNEMLEKYPDFGLIPREMLKEDIYYVTTAENNTVVYFTFCIGGIPTGYQFTSDFKDFQVHGEEFKPFTDIALDEYMLSDFRGRLGKETELYMKSEKLDSEHFDKNDLKLSWMIENGMLFLESEYETSVTDKTVKRYESGKVCVYDKIRVYKIPESSTDVYFHTFPAWSEEVPVPDDVTETVTETGTEPVIEENGEIEINGIVYADRGEYCEIISASDDVPDIVNVPSSVRINGRDLPVKSIFKRAFAKSSITSITLPDGLTSIGMDAFSECFELTSISIPDSVTSIGAAAFLSCKKLKNVTMPSGITEIRDSTFFACKSLTSITIPENVVVIEKLAFASCESLTSITIPDSVEAMGTGVFGDCDELKTIRIGKGLSEMDSYTFGSCGKLESISISKDNLTYRISGGCIVETEIKLLVRAFHNSVIPDDGSVQVIGEGSLINFGNEKSISIPASIIRIDDRAFMPCNKLETVYFGGTEEQWAKISVGLDNSNLRRSEIICSDGIVTMGEETEPEDTDWESGDEPVWETEEPSDPAEKTGFYGDKLHVRTNGTVLAYIRYKAGTDPLTPETLLGSFIQETETEGVVWEVYSAKEYPDLSYVLLISGTNSSWTYGLCDEVISPAG